MAPADARDDSRSRDIAAIKAMGGELPDFEKGAAGVEQMVHPIARQQLAAPDMARARCVAPAQRRGGDIGAQLVGQRAVMRGIGPKRLAVGRERGVENRSAHRPIPISSRPMSMRRTSLVPAPMSSSLASRI